MARILIDGYNLLPATDFKDREAFLHGLSVYAKARSHEVTVVFDGTHQGTGTGDHFHTGSVEVLYSPLTVTADDLIEEILEKPGSANFIVVSSDRRIQSAARKAKATFVTSQEFSRRLAATPRTPAEKEIPPWLEGRSESPRPAPRPGRKLSKAERKRKKGMDRL